METMSVGNLPGEDWIDAGIDDLRGGVRSAAALLVSIGAPRLSKLGYAIPTPFPDPERGLYGLLAEQGWATAHRRYNALVRRLVSFERAVACAR